MQSQRSAIDVVRRCRVTAGSFAAILNPLAVLRSLAGFAVCLAGATGVLSATALPALGADVPFTEHVISTTADGANSVFATDLDGDGDTDVFSASLIRKIAWYESDGGSPPSFTERVISTTAGFARSVFATDVDGDGDIDVLSRHRLMTTRSRGMKATAARPRASPST